MRSWKVLCRHSRGAASVLLGATLACGTLAGCGGTNLSEEQLLSQLRAAGLTVERLDENLITYEQLQRIEAETVIVFSVRVSNTSGQKKELTLVQFDRDWKAAAVAEEGVPGFYIRNWYFVGSGIPEGIRSEIETALT